MNRHNPIQEGHFAVTNAFRKLSFSAAIALLALTGFCFTPSANAQAAAQSLAAVRIVQSVDNSALVTLKGAVHPLANAHNDAGPLSPDTALSRVQLVLKRSPQQESALQQLIQQMHTPGTANYHKWLSPTQFGQQFGPADQDIQTIENWVSSHGFSVGKISPDKGMLEISGTVGQLQDTFHVSMHKYLVNGQEHYANSNDPQIPAALSPVLGGFVSLNNFP
ncbi:MAG TPA: protease pro-enzyme activation domain-containing protein, partial [Acidobacteriaceae bacterium]|nr:protease pro-enzyme activation domain-containing protein [Acidobacteriaceae bacterium]